MKIAYYAVLTMVAVCTLGVVACISSGKPVIAANWFFAAIPWIFTAYSLRKMAKMMEQTKC